MVYEECSRLPLYAGVRIIYCAKPRRCDYNEYCTWLPGMPWLASVTLKRSGISKSLCSCSYFHGCVLGAVAAQNLLITPCHSCGLLYHYGALPPLWHGYSLHRYLLKTLSKLQSLQRVLLAVVAMIARGTSGGRFHGLSEQLWRCLTIYFMVKARHTPFG